MSDRIDELKGKAKEGLGKVTDDEQMEQEGRAEATAAKMEREAEGAVDQAAGKVQETVGDATDDEENELEGKARQLEGDLKRAG